MANPRAKVLGATFAMLAMASVLLISNEENVGANAWALLALSGAFAAAAVMVFFQQGEIGAHATEDSIQAVQNHQTEAQVLPDPAEDGFDIPVV